MAKLNMKTKIMIAGCVALVIAMVCVAVYMSFGKEQPVETTTPVEEAEKSLTESQREAISGYGTGEKEFVARLTDGIWVNTSETESIEFTDATFTINKSGKSETHSYAVQAIETKNENQTSQNQNRQIITASLDTDDGVQILTLTLPTGSQTNPTLKSDYFGQNAYIGTNIGANIDVVGIDDDFLTLLKDGGVQLTREVQLRGAEKYPTATQATWLRECSIDYEDRVIQTSFSYNNKNNSKEKFDIEF